MKRLVGLVLGCLFLGLNIAGAEPPNKKDLPKFIKELGAKDAKARIAAIENIAEIGEIKAVYAKDAVTPLGDVLMKDDDAKVREAAAKALPRIDADPEKAAPALIERIKNEKDRAVLEAAITSAGYFGKAAAEAMPRIKEINDEYREEQQKFNAEAKKLQDDGEREKAQQARGKAQNAGRMVQACTMAMRSIAGTK